MIEDLDALEEIAEFLDSHTEFGKRYEFGEMLDQFRKSMLRELDLPAGSEQSHHARRTAEEF